MIALLWWRLLKAGLSETKTAHQNRHTHDMERDRERWNVRRPSAGEQTNEWTREQKLLVYEIHSLNSTAPYRDCCRVYSISIGVEQWTYDSVCMHLDISNTAHLDGAYELRWMLINVNALHTQFTQYSFSSECVCVWASNWCSGKSFSMCVHIRLKFRCHFFSFIIFHVSTIRCRHNRYCRQPNSHSLLLLLSSSPEIETIFRRKCLCLFYQMCKHFQFSISFKWLWQINSCCCRCLRCCS